MLYPYLLIVAGLFADVGCGLADDTAAEQSKRLPLLDLETHCRAVAVLASTFGDASLCLRKEAAARDSVARQWDSFAVADKRHCLELAKIGEPTYTQLLTCLELAREVRSLREHDAASGERMQAGAEHST
jgi:hypothetical protein